MDNQLIVARNSFVSVGHRKVLPLIKLIQGMKAQDAFNLLSVMNTGCAKDLMLLLNSAMKNAIHNNNITDPNKLYVKEVRLGRAKFLKRFQARARGKGDRYTKHASNICVVLSFMKFGV